MKQLANSLWTSISFKKSGNDSLVSNLKDIAIFQGLSNKDLEFVARILHQRQYSPQELIFKEGEASNGMYIIHHGSVQIYSAETQTQYALLKNGMFFGELALVDSVPRSASAKCTEDTELFGFFKPDLNKIIEKNPKAGVKILQNLGQVLSERLRTTNAHWIELKKEVESEQ